MESRSIEEWRLHRLSCLLLPTEEGNGILALGVTTLEPALILGLLCVQLVILITFQIPHPALSYSTDFDAGSQQGRSTLYGGVSSPSPLEIQELKTLFRGYPRYGCVSLA